MVAARIRQSIIFGDARARKDLQQYKKKGPDVTTKILLQALREHDLKGDHLLDIGGGVGIIPFELCTSGISAAILIDMASAYLKVAEEEACQRDLHQYITFKHGDFIELAGQVPKVDLVTLDRVVCCYPDMESLVNLSTAKCQDWFALSYPKDNWYVRIGNHIKNWMRQLKGDSFRTYVHSEKKIHQLLTSAGFRRIFKGGTFIWEVAIYRYH